MNDKTLTEFVVYLRDKKKLKIPRKPKGEREDYIEVTTIKTADSISIEINDMMRSILDKYKDIPCKDSLVFPYYTNQAMNRDIKDLCRIAGIDREERITTYKGNEMAKMNFMD